MMIDLWEMRNEEVHGKEAAAIEQKRKERAAITVRALHNLEEQARPSDSILFYQDVEATIERVPAATLEGYIAMNTRAITNSVQQWAKRSTGKVRSIINWIVRGTNNKEAVNRIEKRQRDFYRHEAHKKPRKKKRKKDSAVYSTMRQTALSGFISLKNDLY
mmetsp:Transcript_18530/g.20387  ORF Transcript_18530/g.20387 Transcript_18530/m.20387 type:complete len:161 (+) Transcript_18530:85-567(+)